MRLKMSFRPASFKIGGFKPGSLKLGSVMLGSLLAVIMGASATTLALFSDTASKSQEFSAGTVSLYSYRDMGDTVHGPMFYTTPQEGQTEKGLNGRHPTGLWAPGDTWMRVLFVKNAGSLDALLKSVGAELESGSRALADRLTYVVSTDKDGAQVLAAGTLGELIDGDVSFRTTVPVPAQPERPMTARTPVPLYFHVSLPVDADNQLQNQQLQVEFRVTAEQARNNP